MKSVSTAAVTVDCSHLPTGLKHREVPKRYVPPIDFAGVTGWGTIEMNPQALELDPVSTSRVAVLSRARGMWLQYVVMYGHPTPVGAWDVHETLARGVAASPDGLLLDKIASAYPDGLGHSYDVEREYCMLTEQKSFDTSFDFHSPEAIEVLAAHLGPLNMLDFTFPTVAFAATWVALAEICRWRFGLVRQPEPRLPLRAVPTIVGAIRKADRERGIRDYER